MLRRNRRPAQVISVLIVVAAFVLTSATLGRAGSTATYTATQTIPVPPSSSYAGSGGGDGWAAAVGSTQVFNVFHHSSQMTYACHEQADASSCYDPRTISDADGNGFATSGQAGLSLDLTSGRLYGYGTRTSDSTGGVVCIDTTHGATQTDPFCGFTALTAVGDAPLTDGISAISAPAVVGGRYYAFNYAQGAGVTGSKNTLLCFDLSTAAACAAQPYAVGLGLGIVQDGAFPPPAVVAIANRVFVPVSDGGDDNLACFDPSTRTSCAGVWPAPAPANYDSNSGAAFPLLSASGVVTGVCLPTGTDECYGLNGSRVATPANLSSVVTTSTGWNGAALVLGPRVYVPEGGTDLVACYDYSTASGCADFPKSLPGLSFLYTVNPDPQRPTCIWVNADGGSGQIQNFDAYTGGACGDGPIRVLASSFVVDTQLCRPNQYQTLRIVEPARASYTSGTLSFEGADGNPISGLPDQSVARDGTVDLTSLDLPPAAGLPQFLITLVGASSIPGEVKVTLTWTSADDPSCQKPGTIKTGGTDSTSVTTSLSGGGQTGTGLMVPPGTAVTDSATLNGASASSATGTVTYSVFSDAACSTAVSTGGPESITTAGTLPDSAPVSLSTPGRYYWRAAYGGDAANEPSTSPCGSETESVTGGTTAATCALTAVGAATPSSVQLTVQDAADGLAALRVRHANASPAVTGFTAGTTGPVVGTFTKHDETQGGLGALRATTQTGSTVPCGAQFKSLTPRQPFAQGFLFNNKKNSLTIKNGAVGLTSVTISVNGHVSRTRLTNGQTYTLSLTGMVTANGRNNAVTVAGRGPGHGSAVVVVWGVGTAAP